MRILLVTHSYPPDGISGIECYTKRLAVEAIKAGHTVNILARRADLALPVPRLVPERPSDGTSIYQIVGGQLAPDVFLADRERLEQIFRSVLVDASARCGALQSSYGFCAPLYGDSPTVRAARCL